MRVTWNAGTEASRTSQVRRTVETRSQQARFRLTLGHRGIQPFFEPLDLVHQPLMLRIGALFERPQQCPHHPLSTSAKYVLHADRRWPVRMDEFTRQSYRETRSGPSDSLGC